MCGAMSRMDEWSDECSLRVEVMETEFGGVGLSPPPREFSALRLNGSEGDSVDDVFNQSAA